MNREELEKNVIEWGNSKNLTDPVKQTLKTLSEAGELADAICKFDTESYVNNHAGNLHDSKQLTDVIDAIGDIEVCLTILKNQLRLPQDYPLKIAWNEIKDRTGKTVNGSFIKY